MSSIQLDKDIRSLSDFRANTASYIDQVKSNRRPLIITQHGKSSVVLIDVEDYQNMVDKIQLLEEISVAKKELDEGKGITYEDFINELKAKFE